MGSIPTTQLVLVEPALAQPALGPAGSDPRRAPVALAGELLLRMIRHITIHETEVGLLYRKGRFERLLEAGRHRLVGLQVRVTRVDTRRRLLTVGSQEVLTSDSVQLRFSVLVAFRVTDPARATHEFESYEHELHVATQLALRTAIGERTVDELLEQPARPQRAARSSSSARRRPTSALRDRIGAAARHDAAGHAEGRLRRGPAGARGGSRRARARARRVGGGAQPRQRGARHGLHARARRTCACCRRWTRASRCPGTTRFVVHRLRWPVSARRADADHTSDDDR